MLQLDYRSGLLALVMSLVSGHSAFAEDVSQQSNATITGASNYAREIAEIERGLNLQKLMKDRGIPGISVAVVHDYKIVWAKGYGVTDKDGSQAVTPRTLFMAGSISKPVAAVGALVLVERGTLSLEQDANDKLISWKIPSSEFLTQSKVTLGRILDHTAGFSGGDFLPWICRWRRCPHPAPNS